jgi:hypothetical protein
VNDRQKLAALLFRLAGAALILRVLSGLAFFASGASLLAHQYPLYAIYGSNIVCLVLGVVLVLASIPLGKLFGRGLD